MEIIGPQRIQHSPFAPRLARPPPRSREMVPTFHQQSSPTSASATSSSTITTSTANSSSRNQASGSSGRGKKGARGGRDKDGAFVPRSERAREDMRPGRQAHLQLQQRGDGVGVGTSKEAVQVLCKRETRGDPSTTPSNCSTLSTAAPTAAARGRETRSSTASESRRQPLQSSRQQNQNQRRWYRSMQQGGRGGGNNSSGSGPNSPRPSFSGGGTKNRRRRVNSQKLPANEEHTEQHKQQQQHGKPHITSEDKTLDRRSNITSSTAEGGRGGRRKQFSKQRRSRGNRTMSSIDSGKGEDLSSSCESSVFDPQTPSTVVESVFGERRSRCSSVCSSSDDEFHDALSRPASEDDGVNSSAFVTPSTTRPHSPTLLSLNNDDRSLQSQQSSVLAEQSSIDKLCSSLSCLSNDQQEDTQESHDNHVTQSTVTNGDHMTDDTSHMTSSQDERLSREELSTTTESEMDPSPQSCVPPLCTEQVELLPNSSHLSSSSHTNAISSVRTPKSTDVEVRRQQETEDGLMVTEVSDSGNSSAPTSPAKPNLQHNCLPDTAPHLDKHLPSSSLVPLIIPSVSRNGGFCSGSDASPQSSVCSLSTHPHTPPSSTPSQSPPPSTPSQISPSPSPTPLLNPTVVVDTVTEATVENDQLCLAAHTNDEHPTTRGEEWPNLDNFVTTTEVKVQTTEPHPPQDNSINPPSVNSTQCSLNTDERGRDNNSPPCTPSPSSTVTTTTNFTEVEGHQLEPHPHNGAAAYPGPHVVHPPPYMMGWPHQWGTHVHMSTAGLYNQYINYRPQFYHPNTTYYSPMMMWPGIVHPNMEAQTPPSHPGPTSYMYDEIDGDVVANSVGSEDETPPTSGGLVQIETETESTKEDEFETVRHEEEREKIEEMVSVEEKRIENDEEEEEISLEVEGIVEKGLNLSEDGNDCGDRVIPTFHPLEFTWVMWYDKLTGNTRNSSYDYRSSLKNLHTMSSVEDFWQLYNNIVCPSRLDRNSNYHFFKEGIEPMWEDLGNKDGGKWVLTVKDDEHLLDKIWEELLLAMIGGAIHSYVEVNGAVVSRKKKGDRVALWTSKKTAKINLDICADLIKILVSVCDVSTDDLPGFTRQLAEGRGGLSLTYMHHTDSMKSGSSYQKSSRINLKENCESLVSKVLGRLT